MSKPDIFERSVRSAGDLAGVFEYDGETAYYYLYDQTRCDGRMVVDAIHVTSRTPDFEQEDILVEWDPTETKVGLFIKGQLWAAFDESGHKFGGGYRSDDCSDIPSEITAAFAESP